MATIDFTKELRRALSRRRKQVITEAGRVRAAVLLPLYLEQGQYHLLFTKRTEMVKYHKGQISFPGGAYQEEDRTLLDTALRECAEEVGIKPGDVKVLGELDDVLTLASGFIVSPFVAQIPWPYPLRINSYEIEELVEVPIPHLMDKGCVRQETDIIDGMPVTGYFYHYRDKVIWGATARMLTQFLGIATTCLSAKG